MTESKARHFAIIRRQALSAWTTAKGNEDYLGNTSITVACLCRQEMRAVGIPIWAIAYIIYWIALLYIWWQNRSPKESDEEDIEAMMAMGL